ncbi:hypothetical protein A0H81_13065 [Grifola frondosa]|uniref:Uncharacterized protein n=1 Tax=Grifola frondosa TaxID=5627 RepID=A0A1C7LQ90_GRIFR|nr:hypothetical protein A0H81_13065 [Grifola frondosa]
MFFHHFNAERMVCGGDQETTYFYPSAKGQRRQVQLRAPRRWCISSPMAAHDFNAMHQVEFGRFRLLTCAA